MSMVTGMFRDAQSVNQALGALRNVGVNPGEVSVVQSQSTLGNAVGSLASSVLAVGRIVFPPLGLVAAGPMVAALLSAGAAGLLGALEGAGVPEREAHMLEEGVSQGKILLAVHVEDGRASLAREVVQSAGAHVELAA
jgi:hypothetical protein